MNPQIRTPTVRWYRRLDLRLSVLLVVALLGFGYFSDPLYDAVLKRSGFRVGDEDVRVVERQSGETPDAESHAADLAATLLAAGRGSAGNTPAEDDLHGPLGELLALDGEAVVLLDAQGRIALLSQGLPWEVGSRWPFPTQSHTQVAGPDGKDLAHAIYLPLADPAPASTFVLLITEIAPGDEFVCEVTGYTQDVDASGRPIEVFLTEADYEAQMARQDRVVSVVWFLAMMGIAILMAVLISRRVTRRLSRMHAIASRPQPSGRLPGPFDESGGDEVARLAGTMNQMHGRVNQLLDDIRHQETNRREWLAQVSHDLRTPLTALVACLDRAELALQSPRPETLYQEVPEMLAVAKLDIDRVQSLAGDLFEIARLEARDALNLEPVPPGELVRQTVKSLEPLAAKKRVKLEVRLPARLPILSADGRRLMRSLENLLRNAIQHAEAFVWICVDRCDEGLRFEVRDDGPGFPGQEGTLSFDDLRSRRSREDSAGLGLTVTQKVAEAHGGTVGARNDLQGGAVVWFALPLESPLDSETLEELEEEAPAEPDLGAAS